MKFIPLRDRVVAFPLHEDRTSGGTIIIPENAEPRSNQSRLVIVISVGSEVVGVQPHDCIVVGRHVGLEVRLMGLDLLIIPEDDIMGVTE